VWGEIARRDPHALVLLGDTPYIDSTDLQVQRRRYGEFLAHPSVRPCLSFTATYATWDDHDYATNDAFGAVAGRDASRRAFVENHALGSYGDGREGVYTRFRRGPIEVFVLDTRSFADGEPSKFAADQRSLLGSRQLGWLQRGLLESTATFKVLACGMVWNGAVRSGKKDCWASWQAERDGLWRWLGERKVGGVVLVGGDLHVCRLVLHPTKALCGYDLPECVTSPLAAEVIPANAGPIEGAQFDAAVPSTYLLLDATVGEGIAQLVVRFCSGADGTELHGQVFRAVDLQGR
jgi:alkaline phosphatase D